MTARCYSSSVDTSAGGRHAEAMTENDYRRACDLAEAVVDEVSLPKPDWRRIWEMAIELTAIAANAKGAPDA